MPQRDCTAGGVAVGIGAGIAQARRERVLQPGRSVGALHVDGEVHESVSGLGVAVVAQVDIPRGSG